MNSSQIKVCIAGATGWAGSALSLGVHNADNLNLISAVSRSNAGRSLTDILSLDGEGIPIYATAAEALEKGCDVFVEYTKPDVAKANVIAALNAGANVVVGTSGLSAEDYIDIEKVALDLKRSVLAVGNFALTAVLMQKFSEIAARYVPSWEIIDYAHQAKADVPSGTARELAARLGKVAESKLLVRGDQIKGPVEARGARLDGTQVHSVRLPGHVLGVETIFGLQDEKLTIRHDAGSSAEPYVNGAIMAIERVGSFVGLKRGLDSVMEF